jgi:flagellar motility protein MotE (MotC chaperone)
MNWLLREVRLLPLVLFATGSLFALKTFALLSGGGYTLGSPRPAQAEEPASARAKFSDAWNTLGYPDITGAVPQAKPSDKDGGKSAKGPPEKNPAKANPPGEKDKKDGAAGKEENASAAKETASKPGEEPPAGAAPMSEGKAFPVDGRPLSPAERAILERLQERRQELDQRARELDMRETLIAGAEKRLEGRILELKEVEARVNAAMNKRDEVEAARFKSLVSMYENMKSKDAAKIFDRLDPRVLLEVAAQVNPRRMSDILAQMSPEAAERLTVELANRARPSDAAPSANDLPKIEGNNPG